jgi:hypothetical protein
LKGQLVDYRKEKGRIYSQEDLYRGKDHMKIVETKYLTQPHKCSKDERKNVAPDGIIPGYM